MSRIFVEVIVEIRGIATKIPDKIGREFVFSEREFMEYILESERFFEIFSFLSIRICYNLSLLLLDVDIFKLFPFVLCLYHESFNDFSFCGHKFTKFYTFIFKDFN
jgi:hypothetical protein